MLHLKYPRQGLTSLPRPICYICAIIHQIFLHIYLRLPTFDLVSQLAALMLGVVDDRRRRRRSEAILLHLTSVPLLSGQHALTTLPLIEVISGLGKVHMETAGVFFVRAGAQADTITYGNKGLKFRKIKINRRAEGQGKFLLGGGGG